MRPGFTLIELAIALAIASLVTTAAVSATVQMQRSMVTARKVSGLIDDARFSLEFMLKPVRNAGGGAVRPWQSVSTTCSDDGRFALPACTATSGRLHIAEFEVDGQCPIVSLTGANLQALLVAGECCLRLGGVSAYGAGDTVVLFPPESAMAAFGGATWRTRRCTPLAAPACGCTLDDSSLSGFDPPPPAGTVVDGSFTGGTMARGTVRSFFVDPTSRQLRMLSDLERVGAARVTSLTPATTAFQVRLGYDASPIDGVVDSPLATAPAAASLDALRLLRLGLVLSRPTPDGKTDVVNLMGVSVSRPGERAAVAEGNAVMRSLGVFQ